jgi:hypothetical protein
MLTAVLVRIGRRTTQDTDLVVRGVLEDEEGRWRAWS